jgi:hypothetical protein
MQGINIAEVVDGGNKMTKTWNVEEVSEQWHVETIIEYMYMAMGPTPRLLYLNRSIERSSHLLICSYQDKISVSNNDAPGMFSGAPPLVIWHRPSPRFIRVVSKFVRWNIGFTIQCCRVVRWCAHSETRMRGAG